jgi:hypothetical protein
MPDGSTTDGSGTPDCNMMQLELLQNANFDVTPNTAWTEMPASPKTAIIVTQQQLEDQTVTGVAPESGTMLAWLGGVASSSESLTQTVAVPADATALHLQGFYWIATQETMNLPFDHLVLALSNGTGVTHLIQDWTNMNSVGSWTAFDLPISSPATYAGKTWTLSIISTLDNASNTNFFLDTLHLRARVCR